MNIPTPANAPIKRRLSDEEKKVIQDSVLDAPRPGGGDAGAVASSFPVKRPFVPREHLYHRPFAGNAAFAELARQARETNAS